MFTVILRSVCVGIAFLVVSAFAGGFAFALWFSRNLPAAPQQEVGWDLVTMYRNMSSTTRLLPLFFFAVGFLVGYRYFSRSLQDKRARP